MSTAVHTLAATFTRCCQLAFVVHCGAEGNGLARLDGLLKLCISTAFEVSIRRMMYPNSSPSKVCSGQVNTTNPSDCSTPGGGAAVIAATFARLTCKSFRSA